MTNFYKKQWLGRAFIIALISFVVLCANESVAAQDTTGTISLEAQKGKGRRDTRIKKPKNKSRALPEPVCSLEIKNNAAQLVLVYVNGSFRGAVRPGRHFSTSTGAGRSEVYVRTDRTSVNFLYWGPSVVTCNSLQKDKPIVLEINPAKVP